MRGTPGISGGWRSDRPTFFSSHARCSPRAISLHGGSVPFDVWPPAVYSLVTSEPRLGPVDPVTKRKPVARDHRLRGEEGLPALALGRFRHFLGFGRAAAGGRLVHRGSPLAVSVTHGVHALLVTFQLLGVRKLLVAEIASHFVFASSARCEAPEPARL